MIEGANVFMSNVQTKLSQIDYSKSKLTPLHKLGILVAAVIVFTMVYYVFYHHVLLAMIIAIPTAFIAEDKIEKYFISERKKHLQLQFRDLLESMSVSVRAGGNELNALESAYKDLQLTYNPDADIMIELNTIILKNKNGGINLRDLFMDFGKRSNLDDVKSFATIFSVIENKSNRFGDIIRDTHQIISDKVEIEQEIQTMITAAKTESYIMLVMPVVITLAMSVMGGGLMDALFTTLAGRAAATAAIAIFITAFLLAQKFSEINV